MALSVADLRTRYPEFSEAVAADDAVAVALATAAEMAVLSDRITLACAAHLLALGRQETGKADGGAGELTAETIGPKSADYMAQAESGREVFFTTTAYGRAMLTLEKRHPKRAISMFFS